MSTASQKSRTASAASSNVHARGSPQSERPCPARSRYTTCADAARRAKSGLKYEWSKLPGPPCSSRTVGRSSISGPSGTSAGPSTSNHIWMPPASTRIPAVKIRDVAAVEPTLAVRADARAVVLVEGISDRVAVETLAERRGRNLAGEGVVVVPIGGAQAIGRYLNLYGPRGLDLALAGLCDAGEERDFRRGLERAGLGSRLTRLDMESLGFYVCEADLEDELIRALGVETVERVVEANGDLRALRTMQKQPEWRGRPANEQLRRFMGSGGSRKTRYARYLVEALDDGRVPRPLDALLCHV